MITFKMVIEMYKATIFQHAESQIIVGKYDDPLPRYRFKTIITEFENYKDIYFSKENKSLLYKLNYIQNINHNDEYIKLMEKNNGKPNCEYSHVDSEIFIEALNEDEWLPNYSKEWFNENYLELFI